MAEFCESKLVDILRIEGINARGFGTIPQAITRDPRLPIGAKGLYAYFCSFAGSGNTAFPGRDTILNDLKISKDTYYKHLNMLKKLDYIRVEQKIENRCFKRNIFTIVACPNQANYYDKLPCPEKPDTAPLSGFPACPEKPDMPRPKKPDTNINNGNINKKNNQPTNRISNIEKINRCMEIIKENIEYNNLADGQNGELAKSILEIVVETICSDAPSFKIKGAIVDAPVVKRRMLMLTYFDVAYIVNTVSAMDEPIRNPKRYLRSALYNAPVSSALYWKAEVNNLQKRYSEKEQEKKRQAQLERSISDLESLISI